MNTSPETSEAPRCFYCGSEHIKPIYLGHYHNRKKDHGPFDLYICTHCGSALTLPPPTPQSLHELYRSFEFGLSSFSRELLADNPEAVWHDMCARRLIRLSGRSAKDSFTWIDVGAGGGELALRLATEFPNARGRAVDIHAEPPALAGCENVEWCKIDIAEDDFARELGGKADLVFATGVWEHVRMPHIFARNMLALLNPGGTLYMTTPNFGSLARRAFGSRWPYFIPGEHLCMPTPKGARLCLQRELVAINGTEVRSVIAARPVLIRYSLRFVFAKFEMPRIASLIPKSWYAYLPSGAMESIVKLN